MNARAKGPGRLSAPSIQARKLPRDSYGLDIDLDRPPKNVERLVMITAYDAPSARIAHQAGVDMILVGDSLAMVMLGYDDTLQVTVTDIAHHTAAVARGLVSSEAAGVPFARPLVVGDLPWMGYHTDLSEAVKNAAALVRAGAGAVKLEGGRKRLPVIKAILDAEIPVMGHIGLTPQSVNAMGGFKVQGKALEQARELIDDAVALAEAGCFGLVLEGVPDVLGKVISETVDVPVIGIGAGVGCDGQVLVWHDLLGIEDRVSPKFVRRFADVGAVTLAGVEAYVAAVRDASFPSLAESYTASEELQSALLAGNSSAGIAAAARVMSQDAEEFLAGLYGGSAGW
jgi:3-methyl-2-oxobutanoate hydroxymethyltransferase